LPALRKKDMLLSDRLEHYSIRRSDLVITHDSSHANFICDQTGVSQRKIEFLPGGTRGPARKLNSRWLKDKFNLNDENVIILHSGGLGPWFRSLDLALSTSKWPEHWRLLFHTSHKLHKDSYFMNFSRVLENRAVILHDDPVPIRNLDQLVSSADIGIATYCKEILGFRAELLGLAAGKIGSYLKNGLPVIATNLPTVKSYLEEYCCGVTIESFEEVETAVNRILANYKNYSDNALKCFNELWSPEKYCQKILERLESLSNGSFNHA
jgi:glycosyltransferase involved in cell wall biosynthesis